MKKEPPMPIGISREVEYILPSEHADHEETSEALPAFFLAAHIKRKAKCTLDAPETDNRLNLILGLLVVIGLGFAVPLILDCLLVMAEILGHLSEGAQVRWLLILHAVLLGGSAIFLTFPLVCSLYRMAVLMTTENREAEMGKTPQRIGAGECLYPFTSARAYGRTMYVGLRVLIRLVLTLLPPALIVLLAIGGLPILADFVAPPIISFIWVAMIAGACLALWGMILWNSLGAGIAYLVFSRPEMPLKDIRRSFKKSPRSARVPACMMVSFIGWMILSFVAVLIPFLVHTIPYMLLSGASYGQYLFETDPDDANGQTTVSHETVAIAQAACPRSPDRSDVPCEM